MQPVVQFNNVSLTYHSRDCETLALKDISFDVNQGELVGIVGPSGCGKTTILSLIAGIIQPSSGKISICGELPNIKNGKTGYMLQKDELFGWRTIYDNIMLGLEVKHQKNTSTIENAKNLLEKYSLLEFSSRYPSQLSGGMRQRVALIRTLVLEPQILLLDEPFSALDYQTRLKVAQDVYKILKTEEMTSIFVTHDLGEAISMCNKIIVLSNRPTIVNSIYDINELSDLTPMERREDARFGVLFDKIWKKIEGGTSV